MISWTDVVKGKNPPVVVDRESCICPRCGYNWTKPKTNDNSDHEYNWDNRELTKIRRFSVSCGYDMKTNFPIKHGGKFNWESYAQEKTYTIIICGKCRSDFFEPIRKNWWWCNSEEYYKEYKESKEIGYCHYPIHPNDHTFHSELQGYVPQPKIQVDNSADVYFCTRCHVETNIICTVIFCSKSIDFNNGLTTKVNRRCQPYEFFVSQGGHPYKSYGVSGEYTIKLCTCCRDDLVDCMLNEWWNK